MSKKKPKTIYKFICPIFQVEVLLILGDKKQLKKYNISSENSCYDAGVYELLENEIVIGYIVWIENKIAYNSMVHETLHLTRMMFQMLNIPFTAKNDEMIAYYQNYWVRVFWNKMSKFVK